jgi:uncharacterized protein (DUF58 family)
MGGHAGEQAMRPRDVRAILFWIATSIALFLALETAFHHWVMALLATAVYNAWLLSRPRMVRVFRRIRGERFERSGGYYID